MSQFRQRLEKLFDEARGYLELASVEGITKHNERTMCRRAIRTFQKIIDIDELFSLLSNEDRKALITTISKLQEQYNSLIE